MSPRVEIRFLGSPPMIKTQTIVRGCRSHLEVFSRGVSGRFQEWQFLGETKLVSICGIEIPNRGLGQRRDLTSETG